MWKNMESEGEEEPTKKKKKNKIKYVRLLGDASKILWQNCKDSDQAGSTHFF